MADSRGIYSAMEPLDHMLEFEALRRMVIHRKARHPASGIRHPASARNLCRPDRVRGQSAAPHALNTPCSPVHQVHDHRQRRRRGQVRQDRCNARDPKAKLRRAVKGQCANWVRRALPPKAASQNNRPPRPAGPAKRILKSAVRNHTQPTAAAIWRRLQQRGSAWCGEGA